MTGSRKSGAALLFATLLAAAMPGPQGEARAQPAPPPGGDAVQKLQEFRGTGASRDMETVPQTGRRTRPLLQLGARVAAELVQRDGEPVAQPRRRPVPPHVDREVDQAALGVDVAVVVQVVAVSRRWGRHPATLRRRPDGPPGPCRVPSD